MTGGPAFTHISYDDFRVLRLRDAVFAHPTLAEGLNNLFAILDA